MTPQEILIRARALIETPERWTKGAYRRDAAGEKCGVGQAACFCMTGAMLQVTNGQRVTAWWEAADYVYRIAGTTIEHWNDAPERTHAEVLAAFSKAIELAGAEGAAALRARAAQGEPG